MYLSIVIPVFNSEQTIGPLVERLHKCLSSYQFEVVLVNDGSADYSEAVCAALADQFSTVRLVSLRRNFGEFNAVLCGLNHAPGQYVVLIDDDFQNPPEAILTLVETAETGQYDVVYSRYEQKQHPWFRNLGSALVNQLMTDALGKPRDLYLSSFKLIRREVVEEIIRYRGPYPYIDGLIFRVTRNVGSVTVPHHVRPNGRSTYTIRKLANLFLTILVGYSLWPVRLFMGLGIALLGAGTLAGIWLLLRKLLDGVWPPGWWLVVWAVWLATGLVLAAVGVVGEYVGKLYMAHSGLPPYVEKSVGRGMWGGAEAEKSPALPATENP